MSMYWFCIEERKSDRERARVRRTEGERDRSEIERGRSRENQLITKHK